MSEDSIDSINQCASKEPKLYNPFNPLDSDEEDDFDLYLEFLHQYEISMRMVNVYTVDGDLNFPNRMYTMHIVIHFGQVIKDVNISWTIMMYL